MGHALGMGFRLYSLQHSSGSPTWRPEGTVKQDPSVLTYMRNVTGLQGDDHYVFRVDVHYSDDDKVVEKSSMGLVSEPPTQVPCTSEYGRQAFHPHFYECLVWLTNLSLSLLQVSRSVDVVDQPFTLITTSI